jgi:hypothetical protein
MGVIFNTHGRDEKYVQNFGREVDGGIGLILK